MVKSWKFSLSDFNRKSVKNTDQELNEAFKHGISHATGIMNHKNEHFKPFFLTCSQHSGKQVYDIIHDIKLSEIDIHSLGKSDNLGIVFSPVTSDTISTDTTSITIRGVVISFDQSTHHTIFTEEYEINDQNIGLEKQATSN